MHRLALPVGIFFALAAASAFAGRPVIPEERPKLEAAVAAQGCSGGKLEFDDGLYEVDDAKCSDGKIYDLKFDAGFSLLEKKLED